MLQVGLAQPIVPEKRIARRAKRFDETFGPLKPTETLITGIDVEKLMKDLLPDYKKVGPGWRWRSVGWIGVDYSYYHTTNELKNHFRLIIGVFKTQETAQSILAHRVIMRSGGVTPVKDIADRTFLSGESHLLLQRDNAVISVGWSKTKEETLKLARQIDKELQSAKLFVTRGEEVKLPEIEIIGLPTSIRIGERVTCKLKLTNVDPAEALIGSDYDISPGVAVPRGKARGKEPEITYYAPVVPEEAGQKIISISVATPTNVVATKKFEILVESQ